MHTVVRPTTAASTDLKIVARLAPSLSQSSELELLGGQCSRVKYVIDRLNNRMAEDEKFQFVVRRKRGRRIPSVISNKNIVYSSTEPDLDVDKLSRKLNEAKNELNASEYVRTVFKVLTESTEILNAPDIKDLVCYGLGRFSEQKDPRYQLALLLIIKDRFDSNIYIYDPLFSTNEVRYLESIDCRVIKDNEEGKRRVESTTLIYLPHCPKQLTNNFLHANWGPGLKNCIIFSNSFGVILESHTNNILNSTARYIVRINPFVEEIQLPNDFQYRNAFNDSAIHIFTQERLKRIPESFWEDKEEPRYLEEDIEFIANSITQKLTL